MLKTLLAAVALWLTGLVGPAMADAAIRLPPVDYQARVLPNGLSVYAVHDASQPKVSVQLWYKVGSKDDPRGRSGLAHLFEHLMFKGGGEVPPEYLDRLTESVGGRSNASTSRDYTEFHTTVSPDQLERVLWAEAARMSALAIDQADLDSERKVVERELQSSEADDAYARILTWDVPAAALPFPTAPGSTIGAVPELRAVTLEDVRRFHDLYYRPENAVLVVAGDFDPSRLDRWIDAYFGAVRPPPKPPAFARLAADESPGRAQHAARESSAGREVAVIICFPIPSASGADAAALSVLNVMLTRGEGSRGYRALVAPGLADAVVSDVDLRQRGGVVYVGAILADQRSGRRTELALRAQLVALRDQPASAAELQGAKNQLLAQAIEARETLEGVASEIGRAAVLQGDAAHVNADLAAVQAVQPADVQRVARDYLAETRQVTLRLAEGGPQAVADAGADAATPPAAARRPVGPAPVSPPAFHLPEPSAPEAAPPPVRSLLGEEKTLANGLRVVVAPSSRTPLATATLILRGGAALDPAGKPGLTQSTADLALFGAARDTRTASLDGLGLSAVAQVEEAATRLSVSGLSASLPAGLAMIAQGLQRPALGRAEFLQLRRDLAGKVDDAEADIDRLAQAGLDSLLFADRAETARTRAGRARHITMGDLLRQHERLFQPGQAVLVLAGDVEPAAGLALAERLFGGWSAAPVSPAPSRRSAALAAPRVLVIDTPGYPLAEVTVGARTAGRGDGGRIALELASSALGGSYTARLSEEIRVRRGLAYDVSTDLETRDDAGVFAARAEVDPAVAAEVAALMIDQVGGLARTGPTPRELATHKAQLLARLSGDTETTADLADLLAEQALHGEPLGALADYSRRVSAVTAAEVQAAAARLAASGTLHVVIVADASRLPADLKARLPGTKIVTAEALASRLR